MRTVLLPVKKENKEEEDKDPHEPGPRVLGENEENS